MEYIDPKPKFLTYKWKNGKFVGIAWDHGDSFTYKIWTEPDDGGWKKGQELMQNVVQPRDENTTTAEMTKLHKKHPINSTSTATVGPPQKCGCITPSSLEYELGVAQQTD
eukprot:7393383-Ditylum_brightwellii.AAC.1